MADSFEGMKPRELYLCRNQAQTACHLDMFAVPGSWALVVPHSRTARSISQLHHHTNCAARLSYSRNHRHKHQDIFPGHCTQVSSSPASQLDKCCRKDSRRHTACMLCTSFELSACLLRALRGCCCIATHLSAVTSLVKVLLLPSLEEVVVVMLMVWVPGFGSPRQCGFTITFSG